MLREKSLEWFGVLTAIAYSMLVASNTGNEVLGFTLLFISRIIQNPSCTSDADLT